MIQDGLADASYSGIVEGFFQQDELSDELRKKIDMYRTLTRKSELTNDDYAQLALLEASLEEIPDYLDLGIATEYKKLKAEFEQAEEKRKI